MCQLCIVPLVEEEQVGTSMGVTSLEEPVMLPGKVFLAFVAVPVVVLAVVPVVFEVVVVPLVVVPVVF